MAPGRRKIPNKLDLKGLKKELKLFIRELDDSRQRPNSKMVEALDLYVDLLSKNDSSLVHGRHAVTTCAFLYDHGFTVLSPNYKTHNGEKRGRKKPTLRPDIYAKHKNGRKTVTVEIETFQLAGNPKKNMRYHHTLTMPEYFLAKVVGKMRYARLNGNGATENGFWQAHPAGFDPPYFERVRKFFQTNPDERDDEDLQHMKEKFVDEEYTSPKIDFDVLRDSVLDGILYVNPMSKSVEPRYVARNSIGIRQVA